MAVSLLLLVSIATLVAGVYKLFIYPVYLSPLSRIPGPALYTLTKWRLAWEDWTGRRTRTINNLHQRYGTAVRIGPGEVHFNSPSALRTIYGPGSGFGRTAFYQMFAVFGKQNLFTFHSSKDHGERKKLLANAYSKSSINHGPAADLVSGKIQSYLKLIEQLDGAPDDIFTSLHYYSLDSITNFLYGSQCGGTSAMKGNTAHRALLDDILDPARKRLTWFAVHFPRLTKWLYSRSQLIGRLVEPILPMQKPSTYTGIRAHALQAMQDYKAAASQGKLESGTRERIIGRLYKLIDSGIVNLSDLEAASECADHFLAGIDTTSDTMMYMIWSLSLPGNEKYQRELIEEVRSVPEEGLDKYGIPTVESASKLRYFDAVIKETLRLYAPIPGAEPRSSATDTVIDGYQIPAGTIVAMAPYSLHRNAEVFPDPLKWDPDRWIEAEPNHLALMKKWWWPFSSGGRRCVGEHLALAEMTLIPALYRRYATRVATQQEGRAPGITSRFEVFGDDRYPDMTEHACWIQFVKS